MNTAVFIVLGIVATLVMLTFIILLTWLSRQKNVATQTQRVVTDKDILLLIDQQPDGLINARSLAEKTGLSKSEAGIRLYQLATFGALEIHYESNLSKHYSLPVPVDKRPAPALSPEPFLTVEDWLVLFKHYNYRLSPQELILATGLPLPVIKREVKYFTKEKVIKLLVQATHYGQTGKGRSFVLREPYRSQPEKFLEDKLELDQRMKTILRKEDLV